MKLQDYLASLVRTYVPIVVGTIIAKIAALLGIQVDPTGSAELTAQITAVSVLICTAAYYAIVRAAEAKWPMAGLLLGWIKAPHYPEAKK